MAEQQQFNGRILAACERITWQQVEDMSEGNARISASAADALKERWNPLVKGWNVYRIVGLILTPIDEDGGFMLVTGPDGGPPEAVPLPQHLNFLKEVATP